MSTIERAGNLTGGGRAREEDPTPAGKPPFNGVTTVERAGRLLELRVGERRIDADRPVEPHVPPVAEAAAAPAGRSNGPAATAPCPAVLPPVPDTAGDDAAPPPGFGDRLAGAVAPAQPAEQADETAPPHRPPIDHGMAEIDIARLERWGYISPNKPTTRVAEEMRLVKRPLLRHAFAETNGTDVGNVLMVTSSAPNEGKTFVATNLAISMAIERDVYVLLIDADVVQPGIFGTLGLEERPGLIDLLANPTLDASDVIMRTNIEKLSIMSAGTSHAFSTELLASERMRQFVLELASRYKDRIIIFDSPPLLARSEPSVLAHLVGRIIFVVEADRTSESEVRAAMDLIDDCPNVSLVLNKSSSLFARSSFGQYFSRYEGRRRGRRHDEK